MRASLTLFYHRDGHIVDEISAHLDARYMCAPEAVHHILGYPVEKKSDTVYRLAVHLPNKQNITFQARQEREAVERASTRRTTLTAWFAANEESEVLFV